MEEFLNNLTGKKVDVQCGSSRVVRGEVKEIKNGILLLGDEDESVTYIAIDKISILCEVKESQSRPGFVV